MKKWTLEEIDLLREKYPRGTQDELIKIFNTSWKGIKSKARLCDIKRDLTYVYRYAHNKCTVNEDFFKTWSHNMAYILGFITADGCTYENRVKITLNSKDKDILLKMADILGKNINISSNKNTSTLAIRSNEIIKDLSELGLDRKSVV